MLDRLMYCRGVSMLVKLRRYVKSAVLFAGVRMSGMGVTVFSRMGVMKAMLDAVNHTAGTEEQERLEEGMGNQMEDGRAISADAQRRHHETQLADGRIG